MGLREAAGGFERKKQVKSNEGAYESQSCERSHAFQTWDKSRLFVVRTIVSS